MPVNIAGQNFPANIDEMLRNRGVRTIFQSFLIKHVGRDAAAMFAFLEDTPKGYKIYTEYLAPNATTRIKLDGNLQKALDGILAGPQSDAAKQLDVLAVPMKRVFRNVFNRALLGAFYETRFDKGSPLNKVIRSLAAKNCQKKYGKVSVVAERLRTKNKDKVEDIMIAMYMDDDAEARNACKRSGIPFKDFQIMDAIKTQKGLSPEWGQLIKMDAKKLAICGFQNVNDKTLLKLMKQMLDLFVEFSTRKQAPKIFEQVKKKEPKTSPIQKMKFDDMIKLLIKNGAIPNQKYR